MAHQDHIYLSANTLARQISTLADKRIKPFGISTSYAFLLVTIADSPGIGQKELSDQLNLAPSTLTRFFDKLVSKGYLERGKKGREVIPELTPAGKSLSATLQTELKAIEHDIEMITGPKFLDTLNRMIEHGVRTLNDREEN